MNILKSLHWSHTSTACTPVPLLSAGIAESQNSRTKSQKIDEEQCRYYLLGASKASTFLLHLWCSSAGKTDIYYLKIKREVSFYYFLTLKPFCLFLFWFYGVFSSNPWNWIGISLMPNLPEFFRLCSLYETCSFRYMWQTVSRIC